MPDQDYEPTEIGAYGATEQPAVAARMAPHLRMTKIGAGVSVLGVVAGLVGLTQFPLFASAMTGRRWAVAGLVAAILMVVICVVQVAVWLRADASWRGQRVQDLHGEARLSWVTHLVSYAVVLVALLAGMASSAAAQWTSMAAVWLTLSMVFVIMAQVLAGVQYLRPEGPPGTLPAHLRRLAAKTAEARRFDDS